METYQKIDLCLTVYTVPRLAALLGITTQRLRSWRDSPAHAVSPEVSARLNLLVPQKGVSARERRARVKPRRDRC